MTPDIKKWAGCAVQKILWLNHPTHSTEQILLDFSTLKLYESLKKFIGCSSEELTS